MKTTIYSPIKVKNVTEHNGVSVCKGKLVLLKCTQHEYINEKYMCKFGYHIKPIIISDTEEIGAEDNLLVKSTDEIYYVKSVFNGKFICYQNGKYVGDYVTNNIHLYKVLAFPENFSPKHLQSIVDGKLKDGDEVFIEWEWYNDAPMHRVSQIKLNKDKNIVLFPVKKEESWKEFDKWYMDKCDPWGLANYEKVKENWNPPTRKETKREA